MGARPPQVRKGAKNQCGPTEGARWVGLLIAGFVLVSNSAFVMSCRVLGAGREVTISCAVATGLTFRAWVIPMLGANPRKVARHKPSLGETLVRLSY